MAEVVRARVTIRLKVGIFGGTATFLPLLRSRHPIGGLPPCFTACSCAVPFINTGIPNISFEQSSCHVTRSIGSVVYECTNDASIPRGKVRLATGAVGYFCVALSRVSIRSSVKSLFKSVLN